jgi:aminopeptidase N
MVSKASDHKTDEHGCAALKERQAGFRRLNQAAQRSSALNRGADTYDIHHYHFNLDVTNTSTTVGGDVMFKSVVTSPVMDTFWFELRDFMTVDSVRLNNTTYLPASLSRLNHVVRIPLVSNLDAGMAVTCRVYYRGTPPSSGFFSGITSAQSPTWGVNVTWTLSEPFSAPDWFPCKQDLADKIDSVFFDGTSVAPNKVASTGLLVGVDTLSGNRMKFKWRSRYPMAFYLMAFAVTNYTEHLSWAYPAAMGGDSLLIQHWIYNANNSSGTSCLNFNRTALNSTGPMIENFSNLFVLYPFSNEKYGHMMAPLGGGMEHQTMSTMGSFGMDLIAHELAHQWFGDMVTCATWNDIWLNEGWASYGEYLHRQYVISQASASDWMTNTHNSARSATTGSVYVPASGVTNVNRIFSSSLTYKKGAAVLHMLRNEIDNDSLFFGGVRQYLNTKRHSVATTDEFRQIMEQYTGAPLADFFQDWVYGEGHPTYDVRWNWRDSVLWVQTSQTTSAPTVTPVFRNQLPLGLVTSGPGQAPTLIQIEPALGLQRIWIPRQVVSMSLDPNNAILKGTASSITRLSTLGAGLEEDTGQDWLQCYPNPSQGPLNVHLALASNLVLRDMTGKLVWQGQGEEGWNRLDAVTAPGTYLLEAVSINGTRLIRRVSLR